MKKTLTLLLLLAGVTLEARAEDLIWNGIADHMTWNTTDKNWLQGKTSVVYENGSSVVFGDTGSGEVSLAGELKPASVLVEAENEYTFSGTGKLTGKNMTLTKSGSGTLTINTANEYSGGTVIKEGKIVMGNDKALGTGNVTLGSEFAKASLDLAKHTLTANVTVAENTIGGALVQMGNGTLNGDISLGYYSALTLSGNLAGTGDVIMRNCSKLDLNGATLSKNITLDWDASQLNGDAAIGYGTLNGNITVGAKQVLTVLGELSGTGTIFLGDSCSVAVSLLTTSIISKDVNLTGNASISSCTINGKVTVAADKCLTLHGSIDITNEIALGEGSSLDLGNQTMTLQGASSITFSGSFAGIGNGTFNGSFSVGAGKTLSLCGNLTGTGSIVMGADSTLNLNGKTLSKAVALTENASIGNGTIAGSVTVAAGKCLSLKDDYSITGSITLNEGSNLNLGEAETGLDKLTFTGQSATVDNGTLLMESGKTVTLAANLSGSAVIFLESGSKLDLGKHTLSANVTVAEDTVWVEPVQMGNGTLNGNISLGYYGALKLSGDLSGTGDVIMGKCSTLDLNGTALYRDVTLNWDASQGNGYATIGNGTLNGDITVGAKQDLNVLGELSGTGTITLGDSSKVFLGGNTLSKDVNVNGNASFTYGTIKGKVIVAAGKSLSLEGEINMTSELALGEGSTLDLGKQTMNLLDDSSITFSGSSASIGNGTLNGSLSVGTGKTLSLCGNLSGSGTISMNGSAKLNLGKHTLSKNVSLKDSATITAGNTTIKALKEDKEGLLQGLSVSDGLIAGTDRQASLADGLDISRVGDNLTLENLVLTDNNRISVGDSNTITLNNVTIKISNYTYRLMESGEYIFFMKDLFHCDVDMTDVTFDASELRLPEGFNLATGSISFDLGDAKLTSESAYRDISLLMGGYYSQTVSINSYGPVFTSLVKIPEPTTGTLSLLALCALTARRRRKH